MTTNLTDTSTTTAPPKAAEPAAAEVKPRRSRKGSREAYLIDSMQHMGEEGENAVVCVTHCRYDEEVRHPWRECLERCVENVLMRSTFLQMLPEEEHAAPSMDAPLPVGLKKPSAEEIRKIKRRQKDEEL